MQDMETQGTKWISQFKEAIGDEYNFNDVNQLANDVVDQAYTIYGSEKAQEIKKSVENTKQQYLQYLWSLMGQGEFKEYSQNDD